MNDFSNYTFDELRSLERRVADQLKALDEQTKAVARQQIVAIAEGVGVPLQELFGESVRIKGRPRATSAPIRYRNPANRGQSWSGRGRKPRWVQEWLGSGKSIDDLRAS